MRHPSFAVVAITVALFPGCSQSNSQEVASLRAELEKAKAEITELKAEMARKNNNGKLKALPNTKARLLVVRGLRPNWEYPIFEGLNILGRADEQPVDIDLQPQEPEDRVWSSRQHAAITCKAGAMVIEDLNTANGTYVNRKRVPPGEKRSLKKDDIIQVGAVQIKVLW